MAIHINPLGEISDYDSNELLGDACNLNDLRDELGREPTPSDVDRWFRTNTRKALPREVDWRLYQRYMQVSAYFTEDANAIRVVAHNRDDEPRVWLTRYVYVEHGKPAPTVPAPWHAELLDVSSDGWDEYEATLDVTYMHDGEIFQHAYALERHLLPPRKKTLHELITEELDGNGLSVTDPDLVSKSIRKLGANPNDPAPTTEEVELIVLALDGFGLVATDMSLVTRRLHQEA